MTSIKEIRVPDIGDFKSVPVVEIFVSQGDIVNAEDSIIALESDKAVLEIPTPFGGTIESVKVKTGDSVSEGDVIATIAVEESSGEGEKKEIQDGKASHAVNASSAMKPGPAVSHDAEIKERPFSPAVSDGKIYYHASPSVRHFAAELGADLGLITGTGPKNRIRREDVLAFTRTVMKGGQTVSSPGIAVNADEFRKYGEVETAELSKIKKISGPRLQSSWRQIPHVTHFDETDITDLEKFRKQLNEKRKADSAKITMLAFAVKAVAYALKKYPLFNSSLIGSGTEIALKKYYNIGFAVDTENGLTVPVIRNADVKGLFEIADELSALGRLARENRLSVKDMSGATFTISSLGGIGGVNFTPIINPPEAAIMGISKIFIKPVWDEKAGEFAPRMFLPFSVSYDHRIVDGAECARFCVFLGEVLSDLRNLLL